VNRLSTTSAFDPGHDRGFAVTGRRDSELAFRRARRHSRRVRLLRVAIPVTIVLILGSLAFLTWLDPLRLLARLPIDPGKLVISGTKITMEAPKLSGYTRDSRWYELTARSAAQDITNPNIVELREVVAKIETEDKSTMNLSAVDGSFDRKAGILTLGRKIVLTSTSGFEVHLKEAVIDTGSGEIVSNQPVEVRMERGTVNANRLEVLKAGEVVRFDGGVVMNLPPGSINPGEAQAVQQ
jgi:lipopolysaccharide export system protein LptC